MRPKPITVLLAEDHTIVREGLRALLSLEPDLEIVGEAEHGRQAAELALTLRPDVVVMDIAMPMLNGMEATRRILHDNPDTRVLILSAHSDDSYVGKVMALGAAGYLIKQTAASILAKAIREVHQGRSFFSPALLNRGTLVFPNPMEKSAPGPPSESPRLTSREREILQLVAEGKANKQTASELCISIKTVEKHRQSLMEKLAIHDTAGLTRYAIAAGIIESSVQVTIV